MSSSVEKKYSVAFGKRLPYAELFGGVLPVIRVSLNEYVDVLALIDTGAEISLLTTEFAPVVGISNLESGEKVEYIGLHDTVEGFRHQVRIGIEGRFIDCPVMFVEKHGLSELGVPLILGRERVFEQIGPIMFQEINGLKYIYLFGSEGNSTKDP